MGLQAQDEQKVQELQSEPQPQLDRDRPIMAVSEIDAYDAVLVVLCVALCCLFAVLQAVVCCCHGIFNMPYFPSFASFVFSGAILLLNLLQGRRASVPEPPTGVFHHRRLAGTSCCHRIRKQQC